MNKVFRNILISFVGLIVVATTIAVYLLSDFTKTPSGIVSLSFVLLAELILCGFIIGIGFMNKVPNRLFLRAGIISALSLYFVATVILFLISRLFVSNINTLWIFEIILLAMIMVIVIIIILFSSRVNSGNQKILSERRLMQICEKRITDLLSMNKNKSYEPQLVLVLEKLKYCDKIGTTNVDEKIVSCIMRLEKELNISGPELNDIFEELTSLISQRDNEMIENKRGGF